MSPFSPHNYSGSPYPDPDQKQRSSKAGMELLVCISSMVASCARQAKRASKKAVVTTRKQSKQLISSSKAMINGRKSTKKNKNASDDDDDEFGDGAGLWQRSIMMGDKCQPLAFSGVIYYDSCGKQVSALPPKSPRTPINYSYANYAQNQSPYHRP